MKNFVVVVVVAIFGWYGYKHWVGPKQPDKAAHPQVSGNPGSPNPQQAGYKHEVYLLDAGEENDGIGLYKQGRFQDAILQFQANLQNPEQKKDADRNMAYQAKCYEYLGNVAKANEIWEKLLQDFPDSKYKAEGQYFLADAAMKKGLTSSHLKLLSQAGEDFLLSVAGRKAALELAEYYSQKGDEYQFLAWQWYSRAIRSDIPLSKKLEIKKKLDPLVQKIMVTQASKLPGIHTHKVARGDRLILIAKRYKTSIGMMLWMNSKSKPFLRAGEQLVALSGAVWLEVDKQNFFLTMLLPQVGDFNDLYVRGYDVGLGKGGKTPLGEFTIKTKQEKPVWYNEGERIPFEDPRHALGTRWMGFDSKPGISGFGIHGTKEPESMGKNMSNGCVRMRNEEVEELFEFIPMETKVVIR